MSSILKSISNNLCKLSGEDFAIIQKCSKKIRIHFTWIGFFVLLILICCFISAFYFTEHLFHSEILDVLVGFIWGYIVTNMYVLLLYTITPTLLPTKSKNKKKLFVAQKFNFSLSMIIRVVMMLLLAIVTAQPLSVMILNPETKELANAIKFLLANNPFASVITLVLIFIFLFPIYMKYRIRKLDEFYKTKGEITKRFVEDDYKDFKNSYKTIIETQIIKYNKSSWSNLMPLLISLEKHNSHSYQFHFDEISKELINEKIDKYEYWADPPYRTVQKSRIKHIFSEQDLLNHIYPETD